MRCDLRTPVTPGDRPVASDDVSARVWNALTDVIDPARAGEEEFSEGGLWSWLTTVEHRRNGGWVMYFVAAHFFLPGLAAVYLARAG